MAKLSKQEADKRKKYGDKGQAHMMPGDSRDTTETAISNEKESRLGQYTAERAKRAPEDSIQAMKARNAGTLGVPLDMMRYFEANDLHPCWQLVGPDKPVEIYEELGYRAQLDKSGNRIFRSAESNAQSETKHILMVIDNDLHQKHMKIQREATDLKIKETLRTDNNDLVRPVALKTEEVDIDAAVDAFMSS